MEKITLEEFYATSGPNTKAMNDDYIKYCWEFYMSAKFHTELSVEEVKGMYRASRPEKKSIRIWQDALRLLYPRMCDFSHPIYSGFEYVSKVPCRDEGNKVAVQISRLVSQGS